MAGQGDLQELLRIFTSRKVPMIMAMKHAQALQAKNLKRLATHPFPIDGARQTQAC